jgi:NRPS condensation-like uncharacterized protein
LRLRLLRAHETRLESRVTRLNGNLHILRHLVKEGLETEMTNRPSPVLSEEDEDRKIVMGDLESIRGQKRF